MRIVGHGVDLVEIARVEGLIGRHGPRAVERIFTAGEAGYAGASARLRGQRLASRFAAKEAVFKALGTGWSAGIAWTDAEVVMLPSGAPTIRLHGRAGEIAAERGITGWLVSLTHTGTHAAASVIALGER
ncbi:MAG: holo-ACP synthase [Phycisphaeraceae bacterium]|nr:holo-ACP synthase [Phycisphaeraceae bacterium]